MKGREGATRVPARERQGAPLRIVYRDDEGDGQKASRIAQEFVDSLNLLEGSRELRLLVGERRTA